MRLPVQTYEYKNKWGPTGRCDYYYDTQLRVGVGLGRSNGMDHVGLPKRYDKRT
jgi:hypothetical protein